MKALATQYAPSFRLVRAHLGLGIAGSVAVAAALLAVAWSFDGHHFQARFLGVVHLAVLGWLLPISFGAMLQLLPVLFERPLASERAAWAAFALFLAGAGGFIGHLSVLKTGPGLAITAGVLAAAVWAYAVTLARSALQNRRKVRSLTGGFVLSALGWLAFAATLGFLLALNLWHPYLTVNHLVALRAHATSAGLGFFGLLIMGVGFELLEMFLLSHGAPVRAGWVALLATNVGLVVLCADALWGPWGPAASLGAGAAGVGALGFAWRVREIFKRRIKKHLDASAWMTAASALCLVLAVATGLVVLNADLEPQVHERVVLAFGVLAIPGFMGFVVVGQLFKIVPFLVWMHRFSGLVGLRPVPAASDLLDVRARAAQGVLLGAGLGVLLVGVLGGWPAVRFAGALLFFGAMVLGALHLWRISERRP
ncbi:MAG: hypothetical protein IT380_22465 [Myxococcales bacterium]|nr:hypothetical protein [Myxococcales bacterium]